MPPLVKHAQIVLACGAGETHTAIATRLSLSGMTVAKWRNRYRELGLEGLHDELPPDGRAPMRTTRSRGDQRKTPTDGSTQWNPRSLVATSGISMTTLHCWLQAFSVQPHRQKHYRSAEA